MKIIKISVLALSVGLMSFAPVNSIIEKNQSSIVVDSSISWKSDSINLGEVKQNVPAKATFEFTNSGTTAITISHVQASCGCTTTDYTKSAILPGKTATIEVVFNAANLGAFSKTVTVTTDVVSEPKVLQFNGTVIL